MSTLVSGQTLYLAKNTDGLPIDLIAMPSSTIESLREENRLLKRVIELTEENLKLEHANDDLKLKFRELNISFDRARAAAAKRLREEEARVRSEINIDAIAK